MAHGLTHFNTKSGLFPSITKSKTTRPSTRPVILAMTRTQTYRATIESDIESYLKKAIPIRAPESVFEPMHHLTFAAPRTSASALCVAACELVGGDRSDAMAAAAAVHLMHVAAYTHENLPLTDGPMSKSEIQHKFDPNIELLTGDGIIPFGLELMARSMDPTRNNPDRILRAIIELTRVMGSEGIVEGQYHELGLNQLNDLELIEYVCKKKEGTLHACGAACGAILGGCDEDKIEKLRRFGLYVGTVQGLLGKNRSGFEGRIKELKELAVKELESFGGEKIELIRGVFEL
ncbi:polyprenyl synthetase family protein, partial [Acinetobacter baumannii]